MAKVYLITRSEPSWATSQALYAFKHKHIAEKICKLLKQLESIHNKGYDFAINHTNVDPMDYELSLHDLALSIYDTL